MTKNSQSFLLILLLLIILFPLQTGALTLSPPMLELGVEPGGEIVSKIKILNETKDPTTLYVSTANFTSRDEEGNPYFLFEEKEGLADWIQIIPGPIVLLPGERQDIVFTIKVPASADPGGHYAGIFFSSALPEIEQEQGSNIGLVAKLGTLVLLRVSGEVTIKSAVQEFHVLNDQSFFTRLPVRFWYRLYNNGNLHIRPEGVIEIKNIFGITSEKVPANPSEGTVLPDSIRRFESAWEAKKNSAEASEINSKNFLQDFFSQATAEYNNFAFGKYTAFLELTNIPDSLLIKKVSFWVIPWHFLTLAAIAVILALLVIIFIIFRYNRWIVSRAFQQTQQKEKISAKENIESSGSQQSRSGTGPESKDVR